MFAAHRKCLDRSPRRICAGWRPRVRFAPDTPIRKGADGQWVAASRVKGLLDVPAPSQASAPEQQHAAQPTRPTQSASPPAAAPVQKPRVVQSPVAASASQPAAPVKAVPAAPAAKLQEAVQSESNAVEKAVEQKSRKRIWLLTGAGTVVVAAAAAFVLLDPFRLRSGSLPTKAESPNNFAATVASKETAPDNPAQEIAMRKKSMNNLMQLAQLLSSYAAMKETYPAAVQIERNQKVSWRVAILPHLFGGAALYKQYHFDEPWDSPSNLKLIDRMPAVFRDPHDDPKSNDTSYFMVSGKGTMGGVGDGRGKTTKMITDRTYETMILVEAKRKVPWTMPEDIEIDADPKTPLPELGGRYPGIFLASFVDSTTKLISDKIPPERFRDLCTIDGHEQIPESPNEFVFDLPEAERQVVAAKQVLAPIPPEALRAEPDLRKREEESLQGTWDIVSAESNGKSILDDYAGVERVISSSYVIESRTGVEVRRSNFVIDPRQKPKWISMTLWEGVKPVRTFNGIYDLDGDTLKISLVEELDRTKRPPGSRPDDFDDTLYDAVLTVWHRRPPPPKPEELAEKFHGELEARRKDYQTVVATDAAQEAVLREQSLGNLKQLAAALAKYREVKKVFPAATMMANDRVTKVSWRIAILPFLAGSEEIYKRYHFDEAWDGSSATVVDPAAAKEAAMREQSLNNLKKMSLAMQTYLAARKTYPASALLLNNQKASWRVEILPYLDAVDLYRQYNFAEPWDSPNNLKLVDQMPAVFRDPHDDPKTNEPSYFMIAGTGTMGGGDGKGTRLQKITDGTSGTLMLVEAKRNVPWTKPEDIEIDSDANKPLPQFGGRYPGLFLAAFADGVPRPVSDKIEPSRLRALSTIAGGENVSDLLQQRIVGEPKDEAAQPASGKAP
jgi:uncharacterized protein (TIGR03067 family)